MCLLRCEIPVVSVITLKDKPHEVSKGVNAAIVYVYHQRMRAIYRIKHERMPTSVSMSLKQIDFTSLYFKVSRGDDTANKYL